jgi:hypothetical protein
MVGLASILAKPDTNRQLIYNPIKKLFELMTVAWIEPGTIRTQNVSTH